MHWQGRYERQVLRGRQHHQFPLSSWYLQRNRPWCLMVARRGAMILGLAWCALLGFVERNLTLSKKDINILGQVKSMNGYIRVLWRACETIMWNRGTDPIEPASGSKYFNRGQHGVNIIHIRALVTDSWGGKGCAINLGAFEKLEDWGHSITSLDLLLPHRAHTCIFGDYSDPQAELQD